VHNEEVHNIYASSNLIKGIKPRSMIRAGHVARMEQTENAYSMLVGKPRGKRPLGRPTRI